VITCIPVNYTEPPSLTDKKTSAASPEPPIISTTSQTEETPETNISTTPSLESFYSESHEIESNPFEFILVIASIILLLFLLNIFQFVAIAFLIRKNKALARERKNENLIPLRVVKNDVTSEQEAEEMQVNEMYGEFTHESAASEELYAEITEN